MKFLFDLGGVFFDWDPNYFFKKIFSDSSEKAYFFEKICNDEWNIKQDAGRSFQEAENELIPKFPKYEKQIKMYYNNHRSMIKGTFKESIAVLNYLKVKNYECYVLSNWSAETFNGPHKTMIEDYPFLKKFDGLLISGEEKLIKPDPAIYKLAIKKFKLIPNDTLFIDDKLSNIEAAQNLNFKTLHLVDPKTIYEEIEKYLQ